MEAVALTRGSLRSGFLGQSCIEKVQTNSKRCTPIRQQEMRALSRSKCRGQVIEAQVSLSQSGQQPQIGGRTRGHRQALRTVACQAIRETTGKASGEGLKFAVVVARFNDFITKLLLEGAKETFRRHGAADEDIEIVWVPGSFELPVVATSMAKSGKFDAVLCIGAVIRGATTHYEAVVNGATSGILNSSAATGVPVIFGVLTCDTMEQAIDRAGGKAGNKGGECAATAVEMGALLRSLREQGLAAPSWH